MNYTTSTAAEIIDALTFLENEAQRQILMKFFKTGKGQYGEGDQFLGIKVPEVRAIAKDCHALPLPEVQKLIDSPWHEVRLCGFLILVYKFGKLEKKRTLEAMALRDEIIDFYLHNATRANNWDLTDLSCIHTLGQWLLLPSQRTDLQKIEIMDRLAASSNLWEQRISMVSTWATSRSGDPTMALRYAKVHLYHPHDLMHKAVGWMLREVGKHCGLSVLRDFLSEYAATMPRTALRYAIEKMSPTERQQWMSMKR